VAALALLAATPAVLLAADVKHPWLIAGATALAAVVAAAGAVGRNASAGRPSAATSISTACSTGLWSYVDGCPGYG
jgi:hypothetical protein